MGMRRVEERVKGPLQWLNLTENNDIAHQDVPTAPRYPEISKSSWLADHEWVNDLSKLPQATQELQQQQPVMSDLERAEAVKNRAQRRAYDGAPPIIPHAIQTIDVKTCVACHSQESNGLIAGKVPPKMSHPMFTNCTQCHVASEGNDFLKDPNHAGLNVANSFDGARSPGSGSQAYDGAPPVIPHRLNMRQNCQACHGSGMTNAIRTPHPQQQSCLQCHATNAQFDNRESFELNHFYQRK